MTGERLSNHSYRLYIEKPDGSLIGPASVIRADNDQQAISHSKKLVNGFYAELREDARLIETFNESARKRPA